MIAELAVGSATIPDSQPDEAVDVAIVLRPPMPSADYDAELLLPAGIPDEDVKITSKTATEVNVTVIRPQGNTSTPPAVIHAICVKRVGQPNDVPPANPVSVSPPGKGQ